MSTLTPQAPAAALHPTPPVENGAPKRAKFTLTRARDLDARLEAILMRARQAVGELDAVGIDPVVEEQNPVRQQLALIYPSLVAIVEAADAAKVKSAQVATLLDL